MTTRGVEDHLVYFATGINQHLPLNLTYHHNTVTIKLPYGILYVDSDNVVLITSDAIRRYYQDQCYIITNRRCTIVDASTQVDIIPGMIITSWIIITPDRYVIRRFNNKVSIGNTTNKFSYCDDVDYRKLSIFELNYEYTLINDGIFNTVQVVGTISHRKLSFTLTTIGKSICTIQCNDRLHNGIYVNGIFANTVTDGNTVIECTCDEIIENLSETSGFIRLLTRFG
jgi:hypothetical protein